MAAVLDFPDVDTIILTTKKAIVIYSIDIEYRIIAVRIEFLPINVGMAIDPWKRQDSLIPEDGTGREGTRKEYCEQKVFHVPYFFLFRDKFFIPAQTDAISTIVRMDMISSKTSYSTL